MRIGRTKAGRGQATLSTEQHNKHVGRSRVLMDGVDGFQRRVPFGSEFDRFTGSSQHSYLHSHQLVRLAFNGHVGL